MELIFDTLASLDWEMIGATVGMFCTSMAALSTQIKTGDRPGPLGFLFKVVDVFAFNWGRAKNEPALNE